jgi:hypothetical protein
MEEAAEGITSEDSSLHASPQKKALVSASQSPISAGHTSDHGQEGSSHLLWLDHQARAATSNPLPNQQQYCTVDDGSLIDVNTRVITMRSMPSQFELGHYDFLPTGAKGISPSAQLPVRPASLPGLHDWQGSRLLSTAVVTTGTATPLMTPQLQPWQQALQPPITTADAQHPTFSSQLEEPLEASSSPSRGSQTSWLQFRSAPLPRLAMAAAHSPHPPSHSHPLLPLERSSSQVAFDLRNIALSAEREGGETATFSQEKHADIDEFFEEDLFAVARNNQTVQRADASSIDNPFAS